MLNFDLTGCDCLSKSDFATVPDVALSMGSPWRCRSIPMESPWRAARQLGPAGCADLLERVFERIVESTELQVEEEIIESLISRSPTSKSGPPRKFKLICPEVQIDLF